MFLGTHRFDGSPPGAGLLHPRVEPVGELHPLVGATAPFGGGR